MEKSNCKSNDRIAMVLFLHDYRRISNANYLFALSLPNQLGQTRWILNTRIHYFMTGVADLSLDTYTSSQVLNCDGVVIEIYLEWINNFSVHKRLSKYLSLDQLLLS